MTYKWKLHDRPYSDKEAEKLLKPTMDKETANWHYHVHQKGYVEALNKIEADLPKADQSFANGNYSEYGELKRRLPWNHAGALLHDVYWQALGGDGSPWEDLEIVKELSKQYGSYSKWVDDFIATAKSTKLSGWAVLVCDKLYSGRLMNILIDDHQNGAMWGGIPLIALDMFEHAYYHRNGPDRKAYIEGFMSNLNWERINKRYLDFCVSKS